MVADCPRVGNTPWRVLARKSVDVIVPSLFRDLYVFSMSPNARLRVVLGATDLHNYYQHENEVHLACTHW